MGTGPWGLVVRDSSLSRRNWATGGPVLRMIGGYLCRGYLGIRLQTLLHCHLCIYTIFVVQLWSLLLPLLPSSRSRIPIVSFQIIPLAG